VARGRPLVVHRLMAGAASRCAICWLRAIWPSCSTGQLRAGDRKAPRVVNAGGGAARAMSLRELSDWCRQALGTAHPIGSVPETRPFDIPYYVTDSTLAEEGVGMAAGRAARRNPGADPALARQKPAALEIFAP